MNETTNESLKKAGVEQAQRHLFVCLGPECCSAKNGEELWDYVKRRLKETGLPALRTKAGCFRVCTAGPWLVVYPEGTWYNEVNPERFERILQEHLLGGRPIQEWVQATNPLGRSAD